MGDIDIAVVDSLKVLAPDGRLEKRTSQFHGVKSEEESGLSPPP